MSESRLEINAGQLAKKIYCNKFIMNELEEINCNTVDYLVDNLELSLERRKKYLSYDEVIKNLDILQKQLSYLNNFVTKTMLDTNKEFLSVIDKADEINENLYTLKNIDYIHLNDVYKINRIKSLKIHEEVKQFSTNDYAFRKYKLNKNLLSYLEKNNLNNSLAINNLLISAIRKRDGASDVTELQLATYELARKQDQLTNAVLQYLEIINEILGD